MLHTLDSIICLTTVTNLFWGRPVIPSGCLKANSVYTESKSSHATNGIMGEIKEHEFGKSVRRPHYQDPGCRWSAPSVVGQ